MEQWVSLFNDAFDKILITKEKNFKTNGSSNIS